MKSFPHSPPSAIGQPILRHEDPPLLTGQAFYVADLRLERPLHMGVVRSPVAHGVINAIDTDLAQEMPGVQAVFTGAHLADILGAIPRIPPRVSFDQTVVPYLQPVLADHKVRYVGEPVAVVLAEDRYLAEDATEAVFVDISPLPVAVNPSHSGRTALHPEGNLVTTLYAEFGEVDRAFAQAEVVVATELIVGRHSGVPMETRGVAVEFDPVTNRLIIHGATKVPHWNLATTAQLLGIPPSRLRMQETAIGGGFGVRGELYPEDVAAVWAADRLQRSVVWIEDRREHLMTANHSRDQHHHARIAGDRKGHITAIETSFTVDLGAYIRTHSIRVPDLTLSMIPGPYHLPAYRGQAQCVMTNKTPAGTYRAPGRFESSFVRERLIDLYAAEIGIEPREVRRINLIQPAQIPYQRPLSSTGQPIVFGEGNFPAVLERLVDFFDWPALEQRRAKGEKVGVGIAMFLEKSGLGPWETGSIRVAPEGVVIVRSGGSSVGQGFGTVLAQIVADCLEIDPVQVQVARLDSDRTRFGTGSYASRSTVNAGSAVVQAAQQIIAQVKQVASVDFEVSRADLEYQGGWVWVKGSPDFRLSLFDVAARLEPSQAGRYGLDQPGLYAESVFDTQRVVYPCGGCLAVATVDPSTGAVALEHLILCYNVGRAINPVLVAGQMVGGAAQAIGGTLLEDFAYDPDGNPLSTSFMDYLLPTMAEVPKITTLIMEDSPTSTNPLGVNGAGEGGLPGVAAAIATAVEQALGRPGLVTRLPICPQTLLVD